MKKWGKGDPVNLSDLLKITPVANEIMQLSDELDMSIADVIWIAGQIIDSTEEVNEDFIAKIFDFEDDEVPLDDWDDIDFESLDDEMEQAMYIVNVKINSEGRFPEIGFKAGVNEKEDIHYFFDMVLEMLDKLE